MDQRGFGASLHVADARAISVELLDNVAEARAIGRKRRSPPRRSIAIQVDRLAESFPGIGVEGKNPEPCGTLRGRKDDAPLARLAAALRRSVCEALLSGACV